MQHWVLTAIGLLGLANVIVLSVMLLLEKRSPAATLAWLFALAFLPGLGVVIFLFVGPRRLKRSRLRRLRAREAVARPAHELEERVMKEAMSRELSRQIVQIGVRTNRSPVSVAEDVRLLEDGKETFGAILEAIAAAKDHVHVEYYIYEPDRTGTALRDALVERAKAGVEVRLLMDAVGSANIDDRFLAPLREAGGEAYFFNQVRRLRRSRFVNFRNHRKIVVCDGKVGFTGGLNVHDEDNTAYRDDGWRDTHLRLAGSCVTWLQLVFLEDWHYTRGAVPSGDRYLPHDGPGATGELVQILDSGPDSEVETIKTAYFAAINAAKRKVWITTAYFVPDESILLALKAAAHRGVDVRILVPSVSDSAIVMAAGRSYYEELLHTGVRIYEYQRRMLHAKTMVVDDWFSAVGTANMDNRSFRLNFEVTALVYGAKMSHELSVMFKRDRKNAVEILRSHRTKLPVSEKLLEGVARLLSPLL
jgi:cardiolipin synthase